MHTVSPQRDGRIAAFAVTPGDDLRRLILESANAGRPTFTVARGLQVPRLDLVPFPRHGGGTVLLPPNEALDRGPAVRAFHRDALVAIESMNPDAVEKANSNSRARAQLRQLYAAALRDVAGLLLYSRDPNRQAIGGPLGGQLGLSDRSASQRTVRAGRRLWPTLAAWPWWGASTSSLGAFNWWTDPTVLERFAVWQSG